MYRIRAKNLLLVALASMNVLLHALPSAFSSPLVWLPNGPEGGTVNSLTASVHDSSTVIAGGSGGLFLSKDGGATWYPTTVASAIGATSASPAHCPRSLYAGGSSFHRSLDGGKTWAAPATNFPNQSINSILPDPEVCGTLFVGAVSAVFKSSDGGVTWVQLGNGLEAGGPGNVRAILMSPTNDNLMYAQSSRTLYRTIDRGTLWAALAIPSDGALLSDTIIDHAGTIYVATQEEVFRSSNEGLTWQSLGGPPTTGEILALATRGSTEVLAAVKNAGIYRVHPGPWTRVSVSSLPARPTSFASSSSTPARLLLSSSDSGVWASEDGGVTWTSHNEGLHLSIMRDLTEALDGSLYSPTGWGGVQWRPLGSQNWESLSPSGVFVSDIAVAPSDSDSIVALTDRRYALVTRDHGETWTTIELPIQTSNQDNLGVVVPHPTIPGRFYAGTLWGDVFLSEDYGYTWTTFRNGLPTDSWVTDFLFSRLQPERLYLLTRQGLFARENEGVAWTMLRSATPGELFTAVAEDVNGSLIISGSQIQTDGSHRVRLLQSGDSGATWQILPNSFNQNFVHSILFHDGRNAMYLGTPQGVLQSSDQGHSWLSANSGLLRSSALDLLLSRSETGTEVVYASTVNGVYRGEFAPPETLFMRDRRFSLNVSWQTSDSSGQGMLVNLGSGPGPNLMSARSAVFWFFSPKNWEYLVKVIDGCDLTGHYWVFGTALSNVGFTLRARDYLTNEVFTVSNPIGTTPRAVTDTVALASCDQGPAPGPLCTTSATEACLLDGRVGVTLDWETSGGSSGSGMIAQPESGGLARSDDSALLWFFRNDNWEMLVKVLDGCAINDHFWVFSAATTNVEYRIDVLDLWTGRVATWQNELGVSAPSVLDTGAFASCP